MAWTGLDKTMHCVFSLAIAGGFYSLCLRWMVWQPFATRISKRWYCLLTRRWHKMAIRSGAAFLVAFVIFGWGKEVIDAIRPNSSWSWRDIAWDAIGAILGTFQGVLFEVVFSWKAPALRNSSSGEDNASSSTHEQANNRFRSQPAMAGSPHSPDSTIQPMLEEDVTAAKGTKQLSFLEGWWCWEALFSLLFSLALSEGVYGFVLLSLTQQPEDARLSQAERWGVALAVSGCLMGLTHAGWWMVMRRLSGHTATGLYPPAISHSLSATESNSVSSLPFSLHYWQHGWRTGLWTMAGAVGGAVGMLLVDAVGSG